MGHPNHIDDAGATSDSPMANKNKSKNGVFIGTNHMFVSQRMSLSPCTRQLFLANENSCLKKYILNRTYDLKTHPNTCTYMQIYIRILHKSFLLPKRKKRNLMKCYYHIVNWRVKLDNFGKRMLKK